MCIRHATRLIKTQESGVWLYMINGFVTTCKHQYIVRAMLDYTNGFLYAFETHHIILT